MKILVSADWHLKLTQKSVPKEWAISRYRMLFEQLHSIALTTDLHVIAGDIADRPLSIEELSLYFEYIKGCTTKTIIFSGNHEMTTKTLSFLSHLKEVTKSLNPLVSIIDDYTTYCNPDDSLTPLFDIIPYNKLKDFEKNGNDNLKAKLLFTHVRAAIEPYVKPEVDLLIFDKWQTVIAGDLHSYSNSQRNILYPGSPLTTSFHRNHVDTGVIIFDTDTHTHEWVKLKLPQLIRKTIIVGEEMIEDPYDRVIYEVTGDMVELGNIEDSELIDKKVAKRDSDTALILDPNMSIQEEVQEYLMYVLELDQPTVDAAINLLNNNMNKIDD